MKKSPLLSEEEKLSTSKDLERTVLVTLRILRILMESGSNAKVLHEAAYMISKGLHHDLLGLRVGYASITLTMAKNEKTLSRMMTIGRIGVNHRVDHLLRDLALSISKKKMSLNAIDSEVTKILTTTPRHPAWFVALCVGIACASFGRLFGMDWLGFPAAFIGSMLGQYIRHHLIHNGKNVFVVAAFIAFIASFITGLLATYFASQTVNLAMMASILLLVPGVPAANAQADIMDGFPTLGSARAVTVLMIMVFATVGIWLSQTILHVH